MKRIYVIISSFCGLAVAFTICYYASYVRALNNFNDNAVETKISEGNLNNVVAKADTIKINTITPFTNIVIKKYDVATGITTNETQQVTDSIVGYSKEDLQGYCAKFMEKIPVDEQMEGLVSFQIESFSDKQVVLKKTYDSRNCLFKYYMVSQNGYIVVYCNDKKTVYEYTAIQVATLNPVDRKRVADGIYIKNEQELYTILEGYSS